MTGAQVILLLAVCLMVGFVGGIVRVALILRDRP